MDDYTHRGLEDAERETRLLELLPASSFDEPVKVRFRHISLLGAVTPHRAPHLVSFDEVQESLPPGWKLYRNLRGRYIFEEEASARFSWEHPNGDIDHSWYAPEPPSEDRFVPKYEAISYTWCHQPKIKSISVEMLDDSEPGISTKRLAVTESILEILQYLRYEDESRLLWIDTLCIEQDDDEEKGYQVRSMSAIYKIASRVIVWLGPAAEHSNVGIEVMRSLGDQSEIDAHTARWIPSPDASGLEMVGKVAKLSYDSASWDALTKLLGRRWFNRLWVVQEIHGGRPENESIMQCGRDTIEVVKFQRGLCMLEHTPLPTAEARMVVSNAWTLFRWLKDSILRSTLRTASARRACSDPRDKVYGILGMAPRKFAAQIIPNYSPRSTAADTFKEAVLMHLYLVQRLELFDFCQLVTRSIDGPTWVPDWSARSPEAGQSNISSQFPAGASRAHYHYDPQQPGVLEVTGIQCAVVDLVTEPCPAGSDNWDAVRHIRQWESQVLGSSGETYRPTGESSKLAYALTMINYRVRDRWPQYHHFPSLEEWTKQNWEDALFGDFANDDIDKHPPGSLGPSQSKQFGVQFCRGRAFFRTIEGYFGLAPGNTKAGK